MKTRLLILVVCVVVAAIGVTYAWDGGYRNIVGTWEVEHGEGGEFDEPLHSVDAFLVGGVHVEKHPYETLIGTWKRTGYRRFTSVTKAFGDSEEGERYVLTVTQTIQVNSTYDEFDGEFDFRFTWLDGTEFDDGWGTSHGKRLEIE